MKIKGFIISFILCSFFVTSCCLNSTLLVSENFSINKENLSNSIINSLSHGPINIDSEEDILTYGLSGSGFIAPNRVRCNKHIPQTKTSLPRRTIALLFVAAVAGHDDVLPVGPAALGLGNHVVVGQSAQTMTHTAILAFEVVAHGDVDARELDRPPAAHNGTKQAHDRRHLDADGDRPNVLVVLLDDLDLTIEHHADGALPTDDSMGLIALV